jgi:hypothetical protein
MNEKALNGFDFPFQNPFQRKNETFARFIQRCDKSMVEMKQSCEDFLGCNAIWSYGNQTFTQPKNGKTFRGHTE